MRLSLLVKYSKLCNLRCTYCYEMPELSNPARMSLEQVETMFLRVRDHVEKQGEDDSTHQVTFFWHGGEPFVQPVHYWEDIFRRQKAVFSRRRARIFVENHLQTNLTLVAEKHLPFIRKYVRLGFSYDVVNDLRVATGGQPTASIVEKKVEWLLSHGIPMWGNAVISKQNIDRPAVVADYFLRRQLSFIALVIDEAKDSLSGARNAAVGFSKYLQFYKDLYHLPQVQAALQGRVFVEPFTSIREKLKYFGEGYQSPLSEEECAEEEWVIAINTNGDVYSQGDCYDPEYRYGNLFEETFEKVFQSEGRQKRIARSRERLHQTCRQCFLFRKGCGGAYVSHGQPSEVREYQENNGCYRALLGKMMLEEAQAPLEVHTTSRSRSLSPRPSSTATHGRGRVRVLSAPAK